MNITFLSTSVPLTKSYTRDKTGVLTKSSYPNAYEFTSHAEACADLPALLTAINNHAALGHCVLKGTIAKPLISESRAGSTNSHDSTDWLCLDIDGLPENDGATPPVPYSIDDLMTDLGMGDISYVLQWSASYGVSDRMLRAHVFLQLDRQVSAPVIKQWLIQMNHTVAKLRDSQALTRTGNSLTWPLDVTACQNDKLLYIASPVLKGMGNPLGRTPRTSLIKKQLAVFTFPASVNATASRQLTDKRILELRAVAGLPPRKFAYKMVGSHEVIIKPDSCDATEIKQDRGFVYFNINGGDSWAYYHPEDNPDYIYNFKGEPVYQTKDLLPDYWASIQSVGARVSSSGLTYLAFSDRVTGTYWKGTYDQANDELDVIPTRTLILLQDYMKQHGMPKGDFVPEWEMTFDPQSTVTVDFANKIINTFQLSEYMKTEPKEVKTCPPMIFKVIHHALGSDTDITEHFMNWLAYIVQHRDRALTSWVLHGTQGTGKGILINNIIRPLLGRKQTAAIRMRDLGQQYNGYMRQSFIVYVDEMQASAMMDEEGVMADLRNFVTEEHITIRDMYSAPVEVRNYTNWIVSSNKPDPLTIPKNDRRTNVAKYQPVKFYPTEKDLAMWPKHEAQIKRELQAFHDYLYHYAVDKTAAATPIDTEDRHTMISIGENAIDTVSTALLEGSMSFFIDQLPTSNKYQSDPLANARVENYRIVLRDLLTRADALTGWTNIARDELRTLYEYCVGKIPESPNKFTSLIKHHRIHLKRMRIDGDVAIGLATQFKDVAEFGNHLKAHFPQKKVKP